jgi:hypothetical protein
VILLSENLVWLIVVACLVIREWAATAQPTWDGNAYMYIACAAFPCIGTIVSFVR